MDDACNTEELRALAFASIPRKFHCWVRGNNDREEGELSSDGEAELSEFATGIAQRKSGSRRSRNRKNQAVFQSVAPGPYPFHYIPINRLQVSTPLNAVVALKVDNVHAAQVSQGHATLALVSRHQHSSLRARAGTIVQNPAHAPNCQPYAQDRPPGLAATAVTTSSTLPLKTIAPNTAQLQGAGKGKTPTSTVVSMQKTAQGNSNRMPALPSSMQLEARENPFLIKFCDDDSESDGEQLPNSVLALADKAVTASGASVGPKPANLSVEINRMKKQIAAIERVKGKSLSIPKGTKPSKMASSNPFRSNAPDGVTKLIPNCGSNLDTLRQQIASKESELQQQRQRKGTSAFVVPVLPTSKPGALVQSDAGPPKAVVSGPSSDVTGVKLKQAGNLKRLTDEPRMFKYQKKQRSGGHHTVNEPSDCPPIRMENGMKHMRNEETRTTEGSKKTKTATDMASQIVVFSDMNSQQGVIDKNLSSDTPRNCLPSHTGLKHSKALHAPVAVFTEPIVQTTAAGLCTIGSTADNWHQSLKQLEMEEEALDKELEEAQQLRHRSEIRERIARKAYREAQEALRLANMQCDKLHQKREMLALRVKAAEIRTYSSKSLLEEPFTFESQPFPAVAANNPGLLRTLEDASLQAATVSSPLLSNKSLAVQSYVSAGTDDRDHTTSERSRHKDVLESERTDKAQEPHTLPGPYIDLQSKMGVVEQAENGDEATKICDSNLESSMHPHPEIRTSGDELENARNDIAYQNISADLEGTAGARKESWLMEPTGVVCIDPKVNVFEKDCANSAGTMETTTEDSTGYCNQSASAAVTFHEHVNEVCNSEFLNKDAGVKQGSSPCIEEEDLQGSSSSGYAAGREVTSENMDSNTYGKDIEKSSGQPLASESIADMGDLLSLQQASNQNMEGVMKQETFISLVEASTGEADTGSLEEFIDLGNNLHHSDGCVQEKEMSGAKKIRPSRMSAGRLVVFRQVLYKRDGAGIHVLHDKRSSDTSGRAPAVCGDYESPLKNFRSYRVCPQFSSVFGLSEESSTWSHGINPFKPLCKYEHRGKCNNDLCTLQHVNQYKLESGQISQDLQGYRFADAAEREELNVSNAFRKARPSLSKWKWTDHPVPVPTYRIGTYLMRCWEEIHPILPDSVQSGAFDNNFYGFLSSVSTQRPLPNDMPCLLDKLNKGLCSEMDSSGPNEPLSSSRVEGSNDRHLYAELVSRDSGDVDSCLDLALNILQYDINLKNTNCLKNALYILSRALEVKQNSVSLWVVYLILFYRQDTDTKKDDMFLHAVQCNKFSYELWCLVLNSRSNLAAQLESYELAILAMCERGTQDRQKSACILDFALRMLYFMAMSESTAVLVSWMEDLVADSSPDGSVCSRRKSTSAVLRHLLPCDACVLWVSCAYLSAYGSLPKDVISRLGCKQDLPISVEWEIFPPANEESRCRVIKLMKCASSSGIGCLHWSSSAGLVSDDTTLPRQALAVNFVKCLAALEGLDYAAMHGQQLMQLHPSSVELIVLCANIERQRSDCKSGLGVFQNAIFNWPNEKPGIQLLWNQYAGHALEWEGDESAIAVLEKCAASTRELSHFPCTSNTRLFNQQHQNRLEEVRYALKSLSSVGYVKTENSEVSSVQDSTFSLLNLALFEVFCGNMEDAQQALERALSSDQDVTHCWQEYAAYRLFSSLGTSGSQDFLKFQQAFISFLDRCYIHSQLSSTLIPLGREFLKGIKKRRIRCFINNLLGPAPLDHSFINSLLQASFGPELLPINPPDTKNFEQFACGLLELCPANAPLALALCKAVRNSLKTLDCPNSVATSGWAASLLINSLRLSFPVASEACWLEAGDLLEQLGLEDCCPGFYRHALAVYPFSVGLWRCYISHCRRCGNEEAAILVAKGRGLAF